MELAHEKIYTEDDYYNIPEDTHVELIDGKIYDQAAPSRRHQEISGFLHATIYNYIKSKKGSCKVFHAPFAVKLFANRPTIVEPDISVICNPDKLTERGCTGAPDWIIEIVSPSTSAHDYIRKLNLYADAGVREYWIVNPSDRTILVYRLETSNFDNLAYSFQDKIKAGIYEDFAIDFCDLDSE